MESNSNMAKVLGVVVALVLVAGGIFFFMNSGDDEDEAASDTTNTSEQADADEAATQSSIVDLAVATEDLSTLVTAVQAADLVETLSDPDADFTVFAPTNEAFAALPEGTLESLLLPENVEDLSAILTYHVVAGSAMSSDLSDGQELTTVNGEKLTVSITDEGVMIGDAMVVTADIEASNGVVHIIDTVLLP